MTRVAEKPALNAPTFIANSNNSVSSLSNTPNAANNLQTAVPLTLVSGGSYRQREAQIAALSTMIRNMLKASAASPSCWKVYQRAICC
jgi:hypothetical protein